jgi:hypothetical protein
MKLRREQHPTHFNSFDLLLQTAFHTSKKEATVQKLLQLTEPEISNPWKTREFAPNGMAHWVQAGPRAPTPILPHSKLNEKVSNLHCFSQEP